MAVDKKSDYYTTAKNYTDLDGNLRSFDIIDHDVKTSIAAKPLSDEELNEAKQGVRTYREGLIERILALPASTCPDIFQDFTLRGDYVKGILWNETMLKDEGMDIMKLQSLHTLLSNRQGNLL